MPRKYKKKSGLAKTFANLFHPHKGNKHRPKLLHPEALLYFSLIVLAAFSLVRAFKFFPELGSNILGYASNITVEQVIQKTNIKRSSQDLSELIISNELSQAALAKGQDMFSDQYWSHTAPDGREPWVFIEQAGYVYKVAGENLARDFMNTEDMMMAWMASPTHKANILNPKFKEIGIAVIDGKLNGFETTLVVQMFGTKSTTSLIGRSGSEEITDSAKQVTNPQTGTQQVLAAGDILSPVSLRESALLTPLQLTKAFFLAVIILVIMTLVYDSFIASDKKAARIVGKNIGHLMVFSAVAFMLIFFKGGVVN